MTSDEKALSLGQLHLELQEARQQFGCLVSLARKVQAGFKLAMDASVVQEVLPIPSQIGELEIGRFISDIRGTLMEIKRIEKEIKSITPDFQPAPLPSLGNSSALG